MHGLALHSQQLTAPIAEHTRHHADMLTRSLILPNLYPTPRTARRSEIDLSLIAGSGHVTSVVNSRYPVLHFGRFCAHQLLVDPTGW